MNLIKFLFKFKKYLLCLLKYLIRKKVNFPKKYLIIISELLENYKVSQEEDEDYKKIEKFVKTRLTISYKNQNNLLDSNCFLN